MFEIRVDDVIVYACTDERRFVHEATKYARVSNATLTFKDEPYQGWL